MCIYILLSSVCMLTHLLQKNFTEFLKTHYVDGQKKERSISFELKEIIDVILSQISNNNNLLKLFMQESPLLNKKNTSIIKSNSYKINSLNIQLSEMLDQVLTMKEKDLEPFWNKYSKEMSERLWLPLKTALPDSDLICSNSFSIDSVPHSIVSIPLNANPKNKNLQKTYLQSLQFSRQNITEKENTVKVTRKIRIYPNKKQKKFFNKCFGVSRFIYNETVKFVNKKYKEKTNSLNKQRKNGCIAIVKNKQCSNELHSKYFCEKHEKVKIKNNIKVSLPYLRKNVLVNDSEITENNKWLKEIPYDTRQLSIKEFVGAYKSALSNYRNGNNKGFQMKYKSKRNQTQSFHMRKNAINTNLNIFRSRKIGKLRTRNKMKKWFKKNINKIESDCKIIRYKPSQYYLLLTVTKEKKKPNHLFDNVALDPGVRTFQTFYSSDGIAGKFGDNIVNKKLFDIGKRIDKLTSILSKTVNKKTRYNIRKRMALLRTKIKNIVTDLHWKTINFLTNNFKTIILPKFKVKDMTQLTAKCRNISSKSVRKMLQLSHYNFQEKLKCKIKMNNNNLILVNECYTSKTCGNCGYIDKKLGTKKTYKCSECNASIDRDINGARNILLKTLTELNI